MGQSKEEVLTSAHGSWLSMASTRLAPLRKSCYAVAALLLQFCHSHTQFESAM